MKSYQLTLSKALRLDHIPPSRVAFVGAGGKTTALFQAARELAPCIVTTTTHLGAWQADAADQHIIIRKPEDVNQLEEIAFSGVILITGEEKKERLSSPNPEQLNWLEQFCNYHSLPLLIEADGARGKPLKAPKEDEPVIPEFISTVVVVAGLSGIGEGADENVYNSEEFAKLGKRKDEKNNELMNLRGSFTAEAVSSKTVTAEMLANVLMHTEGGLKDIPYKARKIALLNQADTPELQAIGGKLSKEILQKYDSVLVTSLKPETTNSVMTPRGASFRDEAGSSSLRLPRQAKALLAKTSSNIHIFEKPAAIILAAGSSTRFGESKQLLDYHGKPFIRVVVETALKADLHPIMVVTGAEHDKIDAVIHDLPVQVIRNENWQEGQSSSIKVGVKKFGSKAGSAIFLLADQPQVTPTVIRALVEEHARTLHPVIAPMVEDRRANPVLFDRVTFPALLKLEGDIGGRGIFSKFSPNYIHWNDSGLLLDVDTPEAYQKLINR
ncbi:MAG: putative selenium-dependent hydroxylase accessory protein YqeC [Anaerolineae bacterium]|jgi:molybdenum cofactor cytidylyltransferase|nr:putative selenium-dependent hydroxylase accessory protein YqeC [Anaerolineae bacterium]MBT7072641.1 putative selenium-dependent hydroxylase accessory protein YqeC [Anaerolineae bacterium]MBT7324873.1 putative selenium-dependent hydroxylase accessory protein YqeC [Anaerolineae bacterium]